jgi:hypothetical protein
MKHFRINRVAPVVGMVLLVGLLIVGGIFLVNRPSATPADGYNTYAPHLQGLNHNWHEVSATLYLCDANGKLAYQTPVTQVQQQGDYQIMGLGQPLPENTKRCVTLFHLCSTGNVTIGENVMYRAPAQKDTVRFWHDGYVLSKTPLQVGDGYLTDDC